MSNLVMACGGGAIGAQRPLYGWELQCAHCEQWYPMDGYPVALGMRLGVSEILPGYVEVCPLCLGEHFAGHEMPTRIALEEPKEVMGSKE